MSTLTGSAWSAGCCGAPLHDAARCSARLVGLPWRAPRARAAARVWRAPHARSSMQRRARCVRGLCACVARAWRMRVGHSHSLLIPLRFPSGIGLCITCMGCIPCARTRGPPPRGRRPRSCGSPPAAATGGCVGGDAEGGYLLYRPSVWNNGRRAHALRGRVTAGAVRACVGLQPGGAGGAHLEPDLEVERLAVVARGQQQPQREAAVHAAAQQHRHVEARAGDLAPVAARVRCVHMPGPASWLRGKLATHTRVQHARTRTRT